ncbi:MAG TPA: hypothetical protein PLL33_13035, partial [Paracoccus sp. (in: a-proteobacteria)]|nr:hypothetical protein [Paracoccus sp. (in: a-proteobacteria)]
MEAVGNGLLDVALPWLVETRMRPEELRYAVQIDVYRRKLNSVADWLEARIDKIAARPFDAGHIALGVALSVTSRVIIRPLPEQLWSFT